MFFRQSHFYRVHLRSSCSWWSVWSHVRAVQDASVHIQGNSTVAESKDVTESNRFSPNNESAWEGKRCDAHKATFSSDGISMKVYRHYYSRIRTRNLRYYCRNLWQFRNVTHSDNWSRLEFLRIICFMRKENCLLLSDGVILLHYETRSYKAWETR